MHDVARPTVGDGRLHLYMEWRTAACLRLTVDVAVADQRQAVAYAESRRSERGRGSRDGGNVRRRVHFGFEADR